MSAAAQNFPGGNGIELCCSRLSIRRNRPGDAQGLREESKKVFKKSSDDEQTYSKSQPSLGQDLQVRTRSVSVIGPTLKFKGELSANEDLVIEGEIEGTIAHQNKNLTVGKQGRVMADIHANVVEVMGKVNGDIRGDDIVRLTKTAIVNGNIQCARIVMEDGAQFSGGIDMSLRKDAQKSANLTIADKPPGTEKVAS